MLTHEFVRKIKANVSMASKQNRMVKGREIPALVLYLLIVKFKILDADYH